MHRAFLAFEGGSLLCLNHMEGGVCHVTGRECLLGISYDPNCGCDLQGSFDVWVTYDDRILISDIGSPSPEPKRSVALGVQREVAGEVAALAARQTSGQVITTQQKCRRCGNSYWITEHESASVKLGRRYFCPKCIVRINDGGFDVPNYWCG